MEAFATRAQRALYAIPADGGDPGDAGGPRTGEANVDTAVVNLVLMGWLPSRPCGGSGATGSGPGVDGMTPDAAAAAKRPGGERFLNRPLNDDATRPVQTGKQEGMRMLELLLLGLLTVVALVVAVIAVVAAAESGARPADSDRNLP